MEDLICVLECINHEGSDLLQAEIAARTHVSRAIYYLQRANEVRPAMEEAPCLPIT